MKRLVLVRHGESRWNAEARVQGQRCEGLSSLGHAQARVTAAALAAAFPDASLVSSDIRRAAETASALEVELGRSVTTEPALRERSFGNWEGQRRSEIEAGDWDRWLRWLGGEDVVAEVGGESAAELADRVGPALRGLLLATEDGGVTIAVTHGGTIHHGLHRLLGLPPRTLGGVANTSIAEVVAWDAPIAGVTDGTGMALDRWNEVGHLPVELRTNWQARLAAEDVPTATPGTVTAET